MEFPPPPEELIPEDVRTLLKLVGVRCWWDVTWLAFHLQLVALPLVADSNVDVEMLQTVESAGIVIQGMLLQLERNGAR